VGERDLGAAGDAGGGLTSFGTPGRAALNALGPESSRTRHLGSDRLHAPNDWAQRVPSWREDAAARVPVKHRQHRMILIKPPKLVLLDEAQAPVDRLLQALGGELQQYEWPFTAAVELSILVSGVDARVYATLVEHGERGLAGVIRQTVKLTTTIARPDDWQPFIRRITRVVVKRFSQLSGPRPPKALLHWLPSAVLESSALVQHIPAAHAFAMMKNTAG
jgi:hypothetical protein